MRYYVIINGINSLTIPGLAIKDLPPISKTLMRNQKETIDGRDGDIITELGYSAYDKSLTIGLYGSYDINDIIAFFNQKGTIVFSDEPDKYYNFTILDQIDYDKLVKFRTATIRIHCQPFKYPISETPVEIEAEYVTAQGEEITLNDTEESSLGITLKGNTYQETTTGKNLLNNTMLTAEKTVNGVKATPNSDGSVTLSGTATASVYINLANQDFGNTSFTSSQGGSSVYIASIGNTEVSATSLYMAYDKNNHVTYIFVKNGTQINTTVYPMIRLASISDDNYEPYTGGMASPNPSYPQEVQVVTGNNTIKVSNKNLFDKEYAVQKQYISNGTEITARYVLSDNIITIAYDNTTYGRSFLNKFNLKAGTYTIQYRPSLSGTQKTIRFTARDFTNLVDIYSEFIAITDSNVYSYTFTISNDLEVGFSIIPNSSSSGTLSLSNIELEKGSTATEYIEHQEQSYPIHLGSLGLCKIPNTDYQDYIYKSEDKWYKKQYIGKIVLGVDTFYASWRKGSTTEMNRFILDLIPSEQIYLANNNSLSNYFPYNAVNTIGCWRSNHGTQLIINFSEYDTMTASDFENWLSTHNTTLYQPLEEAVDIEITDTDLIEDLNNLYYAYAYQGQTNISQENDNMPFILDVSALQQGSNEAIIDNDGNIYSKPIINIKGNGIIGLSLNGSQILSLDMTTYNDITIDTETMEAYDNNGLRNRQVTGNYNNLILQPGENTISLSGNFTSATISKYKRWL